MRNRLFLLITLLSLFSSCQTIEEDFGRKGGEISFGALSSYSNSAATRTEYSSKDETNNLISSSSSYERIDWVSGSDQIRILCDAAENGPTADYDVSGSTAQGKTSVAGIVPATGNGLRWGTGTHYFYAMYPIPGMSSNYAFTDNNPVSGANVSIASAANNKATVSGKIPSVQEVILVGNEFKANMNYAYMYAAVKRESSSSEDVQLEFKPLVTAVEFTFITPPSDGMTAKLTGLKLSSSSTPLCGSFNATVSVGADPTISMSGTGNEISVTLPGGGVQLDNDEAYKVTLLMLPVNQTDLTLTLNFEGGVKRTLELKDAGSFITIPARKKVYIRNLNVPGRFETEPMQIVVTSNSSLGRTFRIPLSIGSTLPTTIIVDWGDGSAPETYAAGTTITSGSVTHTYAASNDGDHNITITSKYVSGYSGARIPEFNFYTISDGSERMLKELPTPILKTSTESFSQSFRGCTNLVSVCPDLFMKNPGGTNYNYTFYDCSSLTAIPSGLFDNNTNVTSFNNTFYKCTSITSIPAGLFDNNTKVTDFSDTFGECSSITSIPMGLFDKNTEAKYMQETFYKCTSITSIPAGLFDYNTKITTFLYVFRACTGLIGPIPAGLFDNNINVTTFSGTFQGCDHLIGPIPTGLFDNNPKVTSFGSFFSGCTRLTGQIPPGLFDNNPKVTTFSNTFSGCSSLTGSIPTGLFDNNPEVTAFTGTFFGCSDLTGSIPTGLFDNNPKVTSFNQTFYNCSRLTGSIPTGLFDNNPKVTSFNQTFYNCSRLTGSIPTGLFDNNTEVTTFAGLFYSCPQLSGPIPAGLFDNNTKVTTFKNTFANCTQLSGPIPSGLFANNKIVTDFESLFDNCYWLEVVRDVFIKTGVSDPTNRFTGVARAVFTNSFRNTGVNLASRGTAPELWSYTLPSSTITTRCFYKQTGYSTLFANEALIPSTWK